MRYTPGLSGLPQAHYARHNGVPAIVMSIQLLSGHKRRKLLCTQSVRQSDVGSAAAELEARGDAAAAGLLGAGERGWGGSVTGK